MKYLTSLFLILASAGTCAATVSWSPPTQRENGTALALSEISGYSIRYRLVTDNTYSYITVQPSSTTQYQLPLTSGAKYAVQIAAYDTGGLYSNFIDITAKSVSTLPGVPGSPVIDVPACPVIVSNSSSQVATAASSSSKPVISSSSIAAASATSSVASSVSYLTIPYAAKVVPAVLIPGLSAKYYVYRSADFNNVSLSGLTQVNASIVTLQPSASFIATFIQYAGASGINNLASNGENLKTFLKSDADSLDKIPADVGNAGYMRFTGMIKLTAGQYALRVSADDGYSIRINQKVVAEFNGLQPATSRDHPIFIIPTTGYYPIDIKYWDAGGSYSLDVKLANKADNVYNVLSKDILFNF